MTRHVEDLRNLKLAELHVTTFERFILDIALRTVQDERIRASLLRIVPEGAAHRARIAAEMQRINTLLTPAERAEVTRAALLDVLEVEEAARDTYLQLADRMHDPRLARLLLQLAREEDAHVRLAKDLLRLAPPPVHGRIPAQADAGDAPAPRRFQG